MRKSRFCYVVSATKGYLPELVANLNSLDYVGNKEDVHLIGMELQDDFLRQLDKLNYRVIHHDIIEKEWIEARGRSEVACRKRYFFAGEFGKEYEATCVLDADMVWVRNPLLYFEIAAKTKIVIGVGKEQNKVYDDPHHKFNGEWMIEEGYYNDKDVCNCPLFIDANKWEDALKVQWTWFITGFDSGRNMKCPDMDANNIALIKYCGKDNILVIPALQWLGTNEQLLKPYTRAVEDRGKIRTESGIPLFSYHGQFYKRSWRDCQLANRHGCAKGYLKATECSDNMAQGAMDVLYRYFLKMLDYKIQIEKRNYVHPEKPADV